MLVEAGLLIDFGNSQTRVMVVTKNRSFRFNLSNQFAELPPGYRVPPKYVNDKSFIFEYKGSYFANGLIVEREFVGKEMRPSALQSKAEQLVTDLTLNLVFYKALNILATVYNIAPSSLDVVFNMSVLLPPLDHEVNESKMIEKLKSFSSIKTLLPMKLEAKFAVKEVNVFPEAVAAFFGAFFREEGLKDLPENAGKSLHRGDVLVRDNGDHITLVEVPENKKFEKGYVLVLDIGAGTTDVALFKDMELVEMSKETFKRGGNTVASIALNEIRKKYGFSPSSMQRVITTGYLDEGEYKHDVSDIVTAAKEIYAKQTRSDLIPYLERISIDLPVVKGLLVVGGGSLPSVRRLDDKGNEVTDDQIQVGVSYHEQIVSPAMAEILVNFLKELAPRIEVMNTAGRDLRDLNIEGLYILHKYMSSVEE